MGSFSFLFNFCLHTKLRVSWSKRLSPPNSSCSLRNGIACWNIKKLFLLFSLYLSLSYLFKKRSGCYHLHLILCYYTDKETSKRSNKSRDERNPVICHVIIFIWNSFIYKKDENEISISIWWINIMNKSFM
jgi:hypothetical protein